MKKLLSFLTVLSLTLCLAIAGNAAADPDGRPLPWEDASLKVCVVETFSAFEDKDIDILESYLWYAPDYPEATKWENGKYIITDCALKDRITFRFITDMGQQISEDEQKTASGLGFYIENNTKQTLYAGPYMVGTGGNAVVSQGKPIYLVDLNGNIAKAADDEALGLAMVPAGFKGHLVCFMEDLTGASGTGALPESNFIGYPGFEFVNIEVDASQNESIVMDNVFFFGSELRDVERELIMEPDVPETQPPQTSPAQTETAAPSPTLNTQSAAVQTTQAPSSDSASTANAQPSAGSSAQGEEQADSSLIWYIAGAVVILAAAAVIVVVLVKKQKNTK